MKLVYTEIRAEMLADILNLPPGVTINNVAFTPRDNGTIGMSLYGDIFPDVDGGRDGTPRVELVYETIAGCCGSRITRLKRLGSCEVK